MDQQPTWIGRTLSGRYRIDALLGQGGMSAVYKATDPNLKRVVAIKLIHSHLSADPRFVQRFESEASAVASLRHSNIVQVYDSGYDADSHRHFIVMEHCGGGLGPAPIDLQAAIEAWVEQGRAPARLMAAQAQGGVEGRGFTRPLCPYPAVATYAGRGSPDEASSFTCLVPERRPVVIHPAPAYLR